MIWLNEIPWFNYKELTWNLICLLQIFLAEIVFNRIASRKLSYQITLFNFNILKISNSVWRNYKFFIALYWLFVSTEKLDLSHDITSYTGILII